MRIEIIDKYTTKYICNEKEKKEKPEKSGFLKREKEEDK